MMNKRTVGLKHDIYCIYVFVLFFTVLNRTFKPWGLDTRYIVFGLGSILFMLALFSKNSICMDKNFKLILFFYLCIAISMFNQKLFMYDEGVFSNLVILNIYCFFNIVVLNVYHDHFDIKIIYKAFEFAIYCLGLGVLVTYIGLSLPFNDYLAYTTNSEVSEARYCGYGSDPNYVSVIAICFIIFVLTFEKDFKKKLFNILFAIFMLSLSQSRTVIAVSAIIFLIFLFERLLMRRRIIRIFDGIAFIILSVMPLFMVKYRPMNGDVSMTIRYNLWERALNAFLQHPIFGNGLMSVRTVSYLQSGWFVQCHSTYFQILCEQGIIALFLYLLIYWYNFSNCSSKTFKYCFLVYLAWSFTYETVYLPYTILFMGVFPYCNDNFFADSRRLSV